MKNNWHVKEFKFQYSFKVIGIDEDNDDQPWDNLDFDANPGSSGTFQSPTPLEIPAELTQKIHETESIKNEFINAQQEENKSKNSIPVLVPPPVLGLNRKSDLPQMPKLVPCPSPRIRWLVSQKSITKTGVLKCCSNGFHHFFQSIVT